MIARFEDLFYGPVAITTLLFKEPLDPPYMSPPVEAEPPLEI
jgi:hypothetical protein